MSQEPGDGEGMTAREFGVSLWGSEKCSRVRRLHNSENILKTTEFFTLKG